METWCQAEHSLHHESMNADYATCALGEKNLCACLKAVPNINLGTGPCFHHKQHLLYRLFVLEHTYIGGRI